MKRTLFCLAGLSVACSGGDKAADSSAAASASPAPAAVSDVDKALTVRRGIEAAPGNVDSVLAANALTAAGLDSLMYRIASDSAKRAEFSARQ